MQVKAVFLCLLGLGLMPRGAEGQLQDKCRMVESEMKKNCFYDRDIMMTSMPQNLDVLMPGYENWETAWTFLNPVLFCDELELYKDAMYCVANVTEYCMGSSVIKESAVSEEQVYAGMQMLCNARQKVDPFCHLTFLYAVDICLGYNFKNVGIDIIRDSNKKVVCTSLDLTYDCTDLILTPMCGKNSTEVYLDLIDQYGTPSLCKDGSEPARPRERLFPSLPSLLPGGTSSMVGSSDASAINALTTTSIVAVAGAAILLLSALTGFNRFH